MANRQLPSPEVLRQLLSYDQATGLFFWRERTVAECSDARIRNSWNARYANKAAFTGSEATGYKVAKVLGVTVKAHRAAWAMHYGDWPAGWIDHMNGVRTDNRIENLRIASGSENAMNRKVPANSTSGFKGVTWDKEAQKWMAYIKKAGRQTKLGRFDCRIEAAKAYNAAAIVSFGEFASLNEIPAS